MSLLSQQLAGRAAELGRRLAGTLAEGKLVEGFVDGYVGEYDRWGLKTHAQRHRELLTVIGREALLQMVTGVRAELPRHLTRRRPPVLRGPEVRAADAFLNALLDSLAAAMRWGPADAEEFRRDLALYAQLGARQPHQRRRRPGEPAEGPFVDRCALLLDPSMLEAARRAAGKFLGEIEELARGALAGAFRARRSR